MQVVPERKPVNKTACLANTAKSNNTHIDRESCGISVRPQIHGILENSGGNIKQGMRRYALCGNFITQYSGMEKYGTDEILLMFATSQRDVPVLRILPH